MVKIFGFSGEFRNLLKNPSQTTGGADVGKFDWFFKKPIAKPGHMGKIVAV